MLVMLDGDATTCACDPTMAVELVAQRANVVCWVQWVGGDYECVVAEGRHLVGCFAGRSNFAAGHYGCWFVLKVA